MSIAKPYTATLGDYQENARVVRCRYLRRDDAQCTGEAIAPDADVLLCSKHLARAIAIINAQTAAIRQSAKSTR